MKDWLKSRLCIAAAMALASTAAADGWETGMEMPSLSSFSLEGELPDLQGKVVLVDFWASWCAPCKAAFPEMEKIYQDFKDSGFEIVAVSVDQKAKAMQQFLDRRKPTFATPHDASQSLVKAAGIEVMPSSFLVDKQGLIRFAHEGWHGKKSVERLLEQIQTLLAE